MRFLLISLLFCSAVSSYGAGNAKWIRHDKVQLLRGMDLPVKTFRTKDCVFYSGLQYGPKASDVIYLAFDCKERLSPHDVIYAYIPAHAKYGKALRLKGRRRGDSYSFPSIGLDSKFADVGASVNIEIRLRSLWDVSKVDAEVNVTCRLRNVKKANKSTFLLKGSLVSVRNSAVNIEAMHLFCIPELKGRWDHRSDPPHVRGKISMGKLSLVPESGISDKARLLIFEKDALKPKMTRRFRILPRGAYTEFTFYPWKRLKERREYDMKLIMDLKPFFGQLSATDRMVLR